MEKALFESARTKERFELWKFAREIDMFFKPDKDIVFQITEVLKTTIYHFKTLSRKELIHIFPRVLAALRFPPETFPTEQWVRMQINYIQKMKKLAPYFQLKK